MAWRASCPACGTTLSVPPDAPKVICGTCRRILGVADGALHEVDGSPSARPAGASRGPAGGGTDAPAAASGTRRKRGAVRGRGRHRRRETAIPTAVFAAAMAMFVRAALLLLLAVASLMGTLLPAWMVASSVAWAGLDVLLGAFVLKGHQWARMTAISFSAIPLALAGLHPRAVGYGAVFPVIIICCLVGSGPGQWFRRGGDARSRGA